jgi:chemotaxis protein methyltransferase CheR
MSFSAISRPLPASASNAVRIPERTLPLIRDLVHDRTGLHYDDGRLDVIADRLTPLATARGFDSLLDYYYLLKYDQDANDEWVRVVDALSVRETYFWREFDQVRALTHAILPRLAQLHRRPIRIWSLPCATGEEPLSLAMALTDTGWFARAEIEIHAADASAAALARAQSGRFGARAFRQLPGELQQRYFDHDPDAREWVIRPSIYERVRSWQRINVTQPAELQLLQGADVVFCRNMFIYFQEAGIRRVVNDLAGLMASPGYLCVGAAESLLRLGTPFELQDIEGAYVYVKP